MAKGDELRTRRLMDTNNARGQQLYENANAAVGAQGQQFQGDYGRALQSDAGMRDAAFSGYQDFAKTGGFSPTSLAAIRSRAVSPIRSAYSAAQRNVEANRARGGTSAGANTLMARMAREQGQAGADATTNAEASIAQMVQQGKLAGNAGITSLYGTTPGQTALQSRNVLTNMGQGIDLLQGENQRMAGNLGIQNSLNQAPGWGDKVMQRVGQGLGIGAQVGANIFAPTGSLAPKDNLNV